MKNKRIVFLFLLVLVYTDHSFAQEKKDALKLYNNRQYYESAEVCRAELKVLSDSKSRMDSYTVLGWSLIQLKEYEQVLELGQKALSESRYDNRIIEVLGEAHFYLGNTLKSLEYFEEYTVLNPTGDRISRVYYFMGEIFIRLGDYGHADIALTAAVYHQHSIARWWARLGFAREQTQNWSSAIEAYERAVELQPALNEARLGLERIKKRQT